MLRKLLILLPFILCSVAQAQNTPGHYFHTPANAGVNNTFFLDGLCNKLLFIYTQPEIAGMINPVTSSITIDTIWFRHGGSSSNPSTTFTNLVITMGHSTLAVPVASFAANFNTGPPQVVLSAASYTYTYNTGTWNVPSDNWTPIVLQTPFTYNFTDNLAVQIEFAASSAAITGHYADNGGIPITQYASPSTSATANATTSRPMFGISRGCGAPVQLGADTTLCTGQQLTLNAGSPNATHSWSTGANTQSITVNAAGTYWVTVNDTCGTRTDTIVVGLNAQPVADAGNSELICEGSGAQLTASGGANFSWSPPAGLSSTNTAITFASPQSTTTYTVTVSNGNCTDSDTITVTVLPLPPANAGADVSVNYGTDVTLTASGGGSYLWSPAAGLSCINCASPVASPTVTTQYVVTVTSPDGCISTDTVLVTVELNCGDVFVPNVFSPNNDGQNDELEIFGNCITGIVFEVFDRWGNRVFYNTELNRHWDGTHKGEALNNGIYAWQLRATLITGQVIELNGDVQIMR
ncbi:MAG: gliding motility-associated C-terminal domain-containing protein [Bacteroidia bacterium]|jgi:gliding motility-associated-like protein|nr:gliding motility-associated C-terminal domain-containing protein [Bacteroidia bacterium]